jgi:hypothetical protein
LPRAPPRPVSFTEALEKTAMRAATAAQNILFSEPAKAHDDITALLADALAAPQRSAPQTRAPAQRQHGNAMEPRSCRGLDAKLAAEKMNFMAQVSQSFRSSMQVALRSAV